MALNHLEVEASRGAVLKRLLEMQAAGTVPESAEDLAMSFSDIDPTGKILLEIRLSMRLRLMTQARANELWNYALTLPLDPTISTASMQINTDVRGIASAESFGRGGAISADLPAKPSDKLNRQPKPEPAEIAQPAAGNVSEKSKDFEIHVNEDPESKTTCKRCCTTIPPRMIHLCGEGVPVATLRWVAEQWPDLPVRHEDTGVYAASVKQLIAAAQAGTDVQKNCDHSIISPSGVCETCGINMVELQAKCLHSSPHPDGYCHECGKDLRGGQL